MKIAFVLLTYDVDEPAGIERAVAALVEGLHQRGHQAIVVAAGPAAATDAPHLLRLDTVTLRRPMLFDDLPRALADPEPLRAEVSSLLREHGVDLVCWTDAVAGLGYLAPAPPGVRTALMAHLVRGDERMRESIARRPDAVLAVSEFVIEESARAGVDTTGWQVLPNALPGRASPPPPAVREELRRSGPLRTLSRPDPIKGIVGLLDTIPSGFDRRVQIVLADAGFELWPGMQDDVRRECERAARAHPQVELLPALPWHEVQEFLAGAAVAMVPTTWPETFGNVAAEALSAGTPVAGFRLGNLPALVGEGGRLAELPRPSAVQHIGGVSSATAEPPGTRAAFDRLWASVTDLLDDADAYHAASEQAVRAVIQHEPAAVAETFLRLAGVRD